MPAVELVDVFSYVLDIGPNRLVEMRQSSDGPPKRVDGLSIGVVDVEGEGPHGGERHPDGDEILYVISGELILEADAMEEPVRVPAGQACIVRKGEWHKVTSDIPTRMVHITPGPNGDARPK